MSFNQVLNNRLNKANLPENTNIVVLSLVPELDYVDDYIFVFRKEYQDTKTHIYNLKRVYVIKCSTLFYDNRVIITKLLDCVNEAWESYNTFGNKVYERYNWRNTSDIAIVEFEELDIIYQYENTEGNLTEGDIKSYTLNEKKSINKFLGSAVVYQYGADVTIELEYDKKPTESKFKKDIIAEYEKIHTKKGRKENR